MNPHDTVIHATVTALARPAHTIHPTNPYARRPTDANSLVHSVAAPMDNTPARHDGTAATQQALYEAVVTFARAAAITDDDTTPSVLTARAAAQEALEQYRAAVALAATA